MNADLLVVGAGLAGAAAALGAAQKGAQVIICDSGEPPRPQETYDLWFDAAFQLVGGPPMPSIDWACTRFHGFWRDYGFAPDPGYVIDLGALRAAFIAAAEARGAIVHWRTDVVWQGDHYQAGSLAWPGERVILADGLGEVGPGALPADRVWWSQWGGEGTPVSSFLLRAGACPGEGQLVFTAAEAGQWRAFGWHAGDAVDPWRVCLDRAGSVPPPRRQPMRSPRQDGAPSCGPGWLRIGAAAGLVPRHGFGFGQVLATARVAGAMAGEWVLNHADAAEWLTMADVLRIPTYSLRRELPPAL